MCPYAPVPSTDVLMCSLPTDNQYIEYSDATDSHLTDWTILTKGVSRVVDTAIPLIRLEDVVLTPSRSPLCRFFQHSLMTNTLLLLFSSPFVSLVSRLKDKDRMLNGFTYQRDCGKMQSESAGWWQSLAWTDATRWIITMPYMISHILYAVWCLRLYAPVTLIVFFKPFWTRVSFFLNLYLFSYYPHFFFFYKSSCPFFKLQWNFLL